MHITPCLSLINMHPRLFHHKWTAQNTGVNGVKCVSDLMDCDLIT